MLRMKFFKFHKFAYLTGEMGCGAAEATCLGFVCIVVNPLVLSGNIVGFGLFFFDCPISPAVPWNTPTSSSKARPQRRVDPFST